MCNHPLHDPIYCPVCNPHGPIYCPVCNQWLNGSMDAAAFVPALVAVGRPAFNLERAANCASGYLQLTGWTSINRSHCPQKWAALPIYMYTYALLATYYLLLCIYIYIYMTSAQPSANYILVVVVVCADVNAMGRPTFSSMCDIPAAVGWKCWECWTISTNMSSHLESLGGLLWGERLEWPPCPPAFGGLESTEPMEPFPHELRAWHSEETPSGK